MAAAVAQQLLLVLTLLCLTVATASASSSAPSSSYRCGWCRRRRSGTSATASILPPDAATGAACGYGTAISSAAASGGFFFAAASAEFFRRGQAACGVCYQLRCRDRASCGQQGVKVVITDEIKTNRTATASGGWFMLPREALAAMAAPAVHGDLLQQQAVEVDFRRIPCDLHKDRTLAVRVEETSRKDSGRLALRFLYLGGQTDIAAVEVAPAASATLSSSSFSWRYLTRRDGVWSTTRAPAGPLRLRVVVTAGSGGKWLRADREVLPAERMPGGVYDTGLRVDEFAVSTCSCSAGDEDDDKEVHKEEEFR